MKKTVWRIFRDLVNSKSIGTEITRQEILNQVEKELVEIMQLTGHTSERNFFRYIKVTSEQSASQIAGDSFFKK